jgi:hypothetical protein
MAEAGKAGRDLSFWRAAGPSGRFFPMEMADSCSSQHKKSGFFRFSRYSKLSDLY